MERNNNKLTEVIEQHGDTYVAYIIEVPGANTQGATTEEARANLHEAYELIKATLQEIDLL
jgi:predicted RNase H-like HicB family nuclease